MNEIDLIRYYLEKSGIEKVLQISYYNEGQTGIIVPGTVLLGVVAGAPAPHSYFFGNLEVSLTLSGVIVLANTNRITFIAQTVLPGFNEAGRYDASVCIGNGLNLLGDGTYFAHRRKYAIGCNRLDYGLYDAGAATFVVSWNFNGYWFKMR